MIEGNCFDEWKGRESSWMKDASVILRIQMYTHRLKPDRRLSLLAKSQNHQRWLHPMMDTHPLDDVASQPNLPRLEAGLSNPQGLSKKAQKRAAKAARLHELKLERRAREKEAKKHKRRERARAIANGELNENTSRKRRRTNASGETEIFNARVVVDLGFDELMSDKVGISLCSCLLHEMSRPRTGDQFSLFSIGIYVQRKQTCRTRIFGTHIHLAEWQNQTKVRFYE